MSIRTSAIKWTARQPVLLGRITATYIDQKHLWLVVGTSLGYLVLWDLRYSLQVRKWRVSQKPIQVIAGHPARGNGKWIIFSTEGEQYPSVEGEPRVLMSGFDLSNGEIVEHFQTGTFSGTSAALNTASSSSLDAAVEDETAAHTIEALLSGLQTPVLAKAKVLEEHNLSTPSIRAIHTMHILQEAGYSASNDLSPVHETFDPGDEVNKVSSAGGSAVSGIVLSASSDRIVRLWNLGRPSESLVVSAAGKDANKRFK
jgi:phosphoinositide-3-kinase regulatory subunit 4